MGPCAGRLVGLGSLDALLEAAAVSDAAEDARNILRIILIAEAIENLVLFRGVEIGPDIELVAVLEQVGADAVVVRDAGSSRSGIKLQQLDGVGIQPVSRKLIQAGAGGDRRSSLSSPSAGAQAEGIADVTSGGRR